MGAQALLAPLGRRALSRRLGEPDVIGIENVPTSGPAIIACNHLSHLDNAVLQMVLPREVMFVGGSGGSADADAQLRASGIIPIDQTTPGAAQRALDAALEVLDDGRLFAIFPEGAVSPDQRLRKGHTAVARLAIIGRCPVVPVGLVGTADLDELATTGAHGVPCKITIGEPIDPARHVDRPDPARSYRELTDEIMFEIMQLSGQRYVHEYA